MYDEGLASGDIKQLLLHLFYRHSLAFGDELVVEPLDYRPVFLDQVGVRYFQIFQIESDLFLQKIPETDFHTLDHVRVVTRKHHKYHRNKPNFVETVDYINVLASTIERDTRTTIVHDLSVLYFDGTAETNLCVIRQHARHF